MLAQHTSAERCRELIYLSRQMLLMSLDAFDTGFMLLSALPDVPLQLALSRR